LSVSNLKSHVGHKHEVAAKSGQEWSENGTKRKRKRKKNHGHQANPALLESSLLNPYITISATHLQTHIAKVINKKAWYPFISECRGDGRGSEVNTGCSLGVEDFQRLWHTPY
jgi:hypothetical protein